MNDPSSYLNTSPWKASQYCLIHCQRISSVIVIWFALKKHAVRDVGRVFSPTGVTISVSLCRKVFNKQRYSTFELHEIFTILIDVLWIAFLTIFSNLLASRNFSKHRH